MGTAGAYTFGDVRIDRSRMAVDRAGQVVDLEPKAFDVLLFLLDHRDRLVTKEELIDTVWAGTFVTPNALTRAIAQLRKGIGDDASEPKYIETVAKRGYRFIAPVTVASDVTEPAPPVLVPRRSRSWLVVGLAVLVAGALVAWMLRRNERPPVTQAQISPQPSQGQLRRVTTRLGYNGWPAVSPDGSLIAYVSDHTGSLEIYVTTRTAGGRELTITSDGGQNVDPAWSPDGQWLAFHSRKRSGIWIVEATGGVPRQVTDFGSSPAWSPDGTALVFSSDAGGLPAQSTLWTVKRDGAGARQLTRSSNPSGGHREASWSRSGRWIVFTVYRSLSDVPLALLDTHTGAVRVVARPQIVTSPRFSAADRAIVFATWRGTQAVIARYRFDPVEGEVIGVPEIVASMNGRPDAVSVGGDGSIAAGIMQSEANLWAIDVHAGWKVSEPRRITHDAVRNGYPNYGSDGRLVFVRQGVGGSRYSSWIMSDDGTRLEPLIVDRDNGAPHWSPDGTRVLVRHDPEREQRRFWWVDVATRRMTVLPFDAAGIENARLSPDGRDIAYHARGSDGVLNVYVRDVAGGPPRRVTFHPEAASYPAWSPDGRSLAVELKQGDTTQIGIVPREGGPIRVLTSARGQHWPHSWRGEWIAFAGQRDGIWNVYVVSERTAEVRQLTHFTSVDGYVRYPTWSPDSTRIVFERAVISANVWALDEGAGRATIRE